MLKWLYVVLFHSSNCICGEYAFKSFLFQSAGHSSIGHNHKSQYLNSKKYVNINTFLSDWEYRNEYWLLFLGLHTIIGSDVDARLNFIDL